MLIPTTGTCHLLHNLCKNYHKMYSLVAVGQRVLRDKRYLNHGGQACSLRHSWSSLRLKPPLMEKLTLLTCHSNLQLQVYFRPIYNPSLSFPTFACAAFKSHDTTSTSFQYILLLASASMRQYFVIGEKKILLLQDSYYT